MTLSESDMLLEILCADRDASAVSVDVNVADLVPVRLFSSLSVRVVVIVVVCVCSRSEYERIDSVSVLVPTDFESVGVKVDDSLALSVNVTASLLVRENRLHDGTTVFVVVIVVLLPLHCPTGIITSATCSSSAAIMQLVCNIV